MRCQHNNKTPYRCKRKADGQYDGLALCNTHLQQYRQIDANSRGWYKYDAVAIKF